MKLRSVPCGAGLLAGSVDLRGDVSARTAPFSRHGRRPARTPVLPARGTRHTRSSAPHRHWNFWKLVVATFRRKKGGSRALRGFSNAPFRACRDFCVGDPRFRLTAPPWANILPSASRTRVLGGLIERGQSEVFVKRENGDSPDRPRREAQRFLRRKVASYVPRYRASKSHRRPPPTRSHAP